MSIERVVTPDALCYSWECVRGENVEDAKRELLSRLRGEISDARVVDAMEKVPREAFVPQEYRYAAYEDSALPLSEGQTISQPFMIATMIETLGPRRSDKVLEVGTGSGYQAAILAELVRKVLTVERIKSLADSAKDRLESLGYENVTVRVAEERIGWASEAPYDGIVVAAAAPKLIRALVDQLADGGRLVIPVGGRRQQNLMKVVRSNTNYSVTTLSACRFVPLIGQDAWPEPDTES
ncbi:MAG: protein-L-isoaspartate(D-aspartate) O-methyltransferase [Chloroflexi bacterium]|nr:protein-L-isoaspartate(D-aspartate) O-methyltransferase [Chloroflexota bacterium]